MTRESKQKLLAELRGRLQRQRLLLAALDPGDTDDFLKAEVVRSLTDEIASLRRGIAVLERALAGESGSASDGSDGA